MSASEQSPIDYIATPLENGADIGLHHSNLPSAENERTLALAAASMALQSRPEVLKKRELSRVQRATLFGEWVVKIRQADGTDTAASDIDQEALTRDMLDLAA